MYKSREIRKKGDYLGIAETAKVTSKGQVTIPLSIREILRLEPGSTVMFKITDKGLIGSNPQIAFIIDVHPYNNILHFGHL